MLSDHGGSGVCDGGGGVYVAVMYGGGGVCMVVMFGGNVWWWWWGCLLLSAIQCVRNALLSVLHGNTDQVMSC